jgi:hypothetical protein
LTVRRSLRLSLVSLSLYALAFAAPAGAGGEPVCNRANLGQTACFTAKLCECAFDRGGLVSGTPPGYQWDCGILRPSCGEAANVPVTIEEHRGNPPQLPLAVGIDRRPRGSPGKP